jgi:hypothetical protein
MVLNMQKEWHIDMERMSDIFINSIADIFHFVFLALFLF